MNSHRSWFEEAPASPSRGSSFGFALGFVATLAIVAYLVITMLR